MVYIMMTTFTPSSFLLIRYSPIDEETEQQIEIFAPVNIERERESNEQ